MALRGHPQLPAVLRGRRRHPRRRAAGSRTSWHEIGKTSLSRASAFALDRQLPGRPRAVGAVGGHARGPARHARPRPSRPTSPTCSTACTSPSRPRSSGSSCATSMPWPPPGPGSIARHDDRAGGVAAGRQADRLRGVRARPSAHRRRAAPPRVPGADPAERRRLEAWFNDGRHAEPEIIRLPDKLVVNSRDELEFVALERFRAPMFSAPDAMWLADAFNLDHGPQVVSLRAQLQTGEDTNRDLRRSVRLPEQGPRGRPHQQPPRRGQRGERAAGVHPGDPPGVRPGPGRAVAATAARWSSGGARRPARQRDLRRVPVGLYGIETQPLEHRQMLALDEVQPTSRVRCSPWPQRLNLGDGGVLGHRLFTDLGDPEGAFVGQGLPDGDPGLLRPDGGVPARQAAGHLPVRPPGQRQDHAAPAPVPAERAHGAPGHRGQPQGLRLAPAVRRPGQPGHRPHRRAGVTGHAGQRGGRRRVRPVPLRPARHRRQHRGQLRDHGDRPRPAAADRPALRAQPGGGGRGPVRGRGVAVRRRPRRGRPGREDVGVDAAVPAGVGMRPRPRFDEHEMYERADAHRVRRRPEPAVAGQGGLHRRRAHLAWRRSAA